MINQSLKQTYKKNNLKKIINNRIFCKKNKINIIFYNKNKPRKIFI